MKIFLAEKRSRSKAPPQQRFFQKVKKIITFVGMPRYVAAMLCGCAGAGWATRVRTAGQCARVAWTGPRISSPRSLPTRPGTSGASGTPLRR